MTMITCLILWIPDGTTYVPDGPPVTRSGALEHATSKAVTSKPMATMRAGRALRCPAPVTTLP